MIYGLSFYLYKGIINVYIYIFVTHPMFTFTFIGNLNDYAHFIFHQ